jgi:uroporphyrinogen-III synthase
MARKPLSMATTSASHGDLVGAGVIVTRPAGSADPLVRRIRVLGGTALRLPGLALRAPADPARAACALVEASADDWIFSSPTAVRVTFHIASGFHLGKTSRAFAVGSATAHALARHAIPTIAPARADSEGLLALPELAAVHGRRIALVGAPEGRGLIATTLQGRGAEVIAIHVYERAAPRLTQRHFAALEQAADPLILLISSAEALKNLAALLPTPLLSRLHHQPLVASSERLAALAQDRGFADIVLARSALADDLIDAACRALARHRL